MQISRRLLALGATSALLLAACSSSGSSTAPSAAAPSEAAAVGGCVRGRPVRGRIGGRVRGPVQRAQHRLHRLRRVRHRRSRRQGLQRPRQEGPRRRRGARLQDVIGRGAGRHGLRGRTSSACIDQGCQTIITVGFLQSSATAKATLANPNIAFGQVDATWNSAGDDFTPGTADDPPPGVPANFTGLDYQVDQAAMLAGYLAASFSKSGKVGTYGGLAFPGVTRFMDGFYAGRPVPQPAEGHDRRGRRLGRLARGSHHDRHLRRRQRWHRHLERPGQGRAVRQDLPRPGRGHRPSGRGRDGQRHHQGDARGRQVGDRASTTTRRITLPEYAGAILTSAQKAIDVSVLDVIKKTSGGDLGGEDYSGTLANSRRAPVPVPRLRQPDLRPRPRPSSMR